MRGLPLRRRSERQEVGMNFARRGLVMIDRLYRGRPLSGPARVAWCWLVRHA